MRDGPVVPVKLVVGELRRRSGEKSPARMRRQSVQVDRESLRRWLGISPDPERTREQSVFRLKIFHFIFIYC